MTLWSTILRLLAAIALIAYPVFVWLGLSSGSPRQVALVLLLVMTPAVVLRMRGSSRHAVRGLAAVPLTIFGILAVAALLDAGDWMLATPLATNVVLLIVFGSTLRASSTPMIERFARLQVRELSDEQLAWCRRWTWIWCGFFIGNGTIALALALLAPLAWWAFYNGLLCYGLIGSLILLEWWLRRRRFPDLRSGPESSLGPKSQHGPESRHGPKPRHGKVEA